MKLEKETWTPVLLKQKAEEYKASAEIASLKSRGSADEASLGERAKSTKEEAKGWWRKYDIAAREVKSAFGKEAFVQKCTTRICTKGKIG